MTGDLYACPAEGCDYGPLPKESVAGHYGGKCDGAHSGGYQAAVRALEAAGPVEQDSDQARAAEPAGGGEPASADAGQTDPSGEQVAAPVPEPDDDGDAGCPECGETDWFDPAETLRSQGLNPEAFDAGGHDRGCPNCSTAEEWVVYDV